MKGIDIVMNRWFVITAETGIWNSRVSFHLSPSETCNEICNETRITALERASKPSGSPSERASEPFESPLEKALKPFAWRYRIDSLWYQQKHMFWVPVWSFYLFPLKLSLEFAMKPVSVFIIAIVIVVPVIVIVVRCLENSELIFFDIIPDSSNWCHFTSASWFRTLAL